MTGNMQCFSYLQTVEKSFFDYLNYLNYLTTLTSACLLEGTPPDPPTSLALQYFRTTSACLIRLRYYIQLDRV